MHVIEITKSTARALVHGMTAKRWSLPHAALTRPVPLLAPSTRPKECNATPQVGIADTEDNRAEFETQSNPTPPVSSPFSCVTIFDLNALYLSPHYRNAAYPTCEKHLSCMSGGYGTTPTVPPLAFG